MTRFLIAIPPPLLKHMDAVQEMISMNQGTLALIILVCFGLGWLYAKTKNR